MDTSMLLPFSPSIFRFLSTRQLHIINSFSLSLSLVSFSLFLSLFPRVLIERFGARLTDEQILFVKTRLCEQLQGYLMGMPITSWMQTNLIDGCATVELSHLLTTRESNGERNRRFSLHSLDLSFFTPDVLLVNWQSERERKNDAENNNSLSTVVFSLSPSLFFSLPFFSSLFLASERWFRGIFFSFSSLRLFKQRDCISSDRE